MPPMPNLRSLCFLLLNPAAEFQETVNQSKAIRPPSRCETTTRRVLKAVALAESFAKTAL